MSQSFNLALAQMLVLPGDMAGNLARAGERIATAAARGASVVLLPEALDCGWAHPSARELAGTIPDGEACRFLCLAAQQRDVFICAGLVERVGERLFNAAVLIDPQGHVVLHHRKIHELDFARESYSVGDRLGVAETPWGRAGLMICADAFAPGQVISRSLAMMGARFILSPCAWAVPADHDNSQQPYGQLWLDNYGPWRASSACGSPDAATSVRSRRASGRGGSALGTRWCAVPTEEWRRGAPTEQRQTNFCWCG